jgi:hypothetical protein
VELDKMDRKTEQLVTSYFPSECILSTEAQESYFANSCPAEEYQDETGSSSWR